MHANKRAEMAEKYGRGTGAKQAVIGLLERDGKVITFTVDSEAGKVVKPIIRELVSKDAILITDAHGGYKDLGKEFNHIVVNHQGGVYTVGPYHTNSIEGVWAIFKRGIYGIYHHASPKHLNAYCREFSYRYNTRKITDVDRFGEILTQTKGRLKYNDLIAA